MKLNLVKKEEEYKLQLSRKGLKRLESGKIVLINKKSHSQLNVISGGGKREIKDEYEYEGLGEVYFITPTTLSIYYLFSIG